jgi:hypothetical protein
MGFGDHRQAPTVSSTHATRTAGNHRENMDLEASAVLPPSLMLGMKTNLRMRRRKQQHPL